MAGSPAYLQLLGDISALPPSPFNTWDDLDDAWTELERHEDRRALFHVATTAFSVLARETGTSIEELMLAATQLHINKNAGYAGADNPDPWANFRMSSAFNVSPVRGVFVRMSDKYIRITNLRRNADNDRIGESIIDTLRDLAAYALIAICLLEEDAA